jgi:multidrug efflux system outer membrane protein
MRRSFCAIVLALFSLAGCSLAPDYIRPTPPVPAHWPAGPAFKGITGAETRPVADEIAWRSFYTDERLQGVIELALNNNRDLRIAGSNIERARALYRIQRAQQFPELDAAGGWSARRVPAGISQTGESMIARQYFIDSGVTSWELDFFGRIRSLKDRALQQYLATEQASRSAEILIVAEVANVFLTRAADCESLKLARSTLEARQDSYNMIRRRFDVGTSSALDMRQAQTLLEGARADVVRYTRQVALDENALNLLVGAQVPGDLLPGELNAVKLPKDISAGLYSDVLLSRPDILESENLLKAANANIGAARAAFFPRIALTSSIGTISPDLSGLFRAGSSTWLFSPQISLPIFDSGSRRANLQATEADRDISQARYEKSIQVAFKETADALAFRGTLGDQISAQESLVEASADAYRLSDARYEKGIDNYLTVLDAQRSLYAGQQGLITLHLARMSNLVNLYRVLGGRGFSGN